MNIEKETELAAIFDNIETVQVAILDIDAAINLLNTETLEIECTLNIVEQCKLGIFEFHSFGYVFHLGNDDKKDLTELLNKKMARLNEQLVRLNREYATAKIEALNTKTNA